MRIKYLFSILLMIFCCTAKAQNPSNLPSPNSPGSYYNLGWVKSDSGNIFASRTPNFTPLYPFTVVGYIRPGIDSALWLWTGQTWNEIGKGGGILSLTGVSPIVFRNDSILCPTCSVGGGITQLTGDGIAGPGSGSQVLTLATVNANVGSFGDAGHVADFTVNAKGLITVAGAVPIQIGESQVTNLTSDLASKQPAISLGSTSQYFRGDLSLATFPTNLSAFTNGPGFISTISGIVAGGSLTGTYPNPTLAAVVTGGAGSCVNCNLSYNAAGQITLAANGSGGGGSQNLTYTQLATTNTLSISGGNSQTFLPATELLSGLLDTSRAKTIDSIHNRTFVFAPDTVHLSAYGTGVNLLSTNTAGSILYHKTGENSTTNSIVANSDSSFSVNSLLAATKSLTSSGANWSLLNDTSFTSGAGYWIYGYNNSRLGYYNFITGPLANSTTPGLLSAAGYVLLNFQQTILNSPVGYAADSFASASVTQDTLYIARLAIRSGTSFFSVDSTSQSNVNINAFVLNMPNQTANTLLGYNTSGVASLITAGTNITISGGVISASGGGGSQTFQQVLTTGNTLTIPDTVKQAGNVFSFTGGDMGIGIMGTTSSSLTVGMTNYNSSLGTGAVFSGGSTNDPITAASGTVSQMTGNLFKQTTFTASNTGVVYTTAANLWVAGNAIAGTNVTITNTYGIYSVGNIGTSGDISAGTTIGNNAFVQVGANTTTTASLYLSPSSAVNVTAPVSGQLWWNGTNLYFYNGSANKDLLASGSGGDAITSPNTTITVGGTSTATTLDLNLSHSNTWTGKAIWQQNSIGTTVTDGDEYLNSTAAATGAQQISPAIHLQGQGWKTASTAASEPVDGWIYMLPVQSSAAPISTMVFALSANSGTVTNILTLNNGASVVGTLSATSTITTSANIGISATGTLFWGTTGATSGNLYNDNNYTLNVRNGTNGCAVQVDNTFTTTSNYEGASMGFIANTNVFTIQTQTTGGTLRNGELAGGTWGIGTAPVSTSELTLAAPTTTLASMTLTPSSAVNVTSPVNGNLWYNGTNLYFYNGSSNKDLLASGGITTIGSPSTSYANGASISGSTLTLGLASSSNPGIIAGSGAQTLGATLTLSNVLTVNAAIKTSSTNGVNIGAKNDGLSGSGAGTITSYAVPGSGSTNNFEVAAYVNILAIVTDVVQVQVTFTGEDNASHTLTLFPQGLTSAGLSAIGYYPFPPIFISVKQGTTITVAAVFTIGTGSVTYDSGAIITQMY